jgi:curved DNA-binding protein CbpA
MAQTARDAYATLGVAPDASDADLRAAYRRLVQLHHPDHNGGSPESERRFEGIQAAYATVREARSSGAPAPGPGETDGRLADMEREIREAHQARERAQRAAREAAAQAAQATGQAERKRPSDEELGYVTTDDSFTKIFADARSELASRLADERQKPLAKRLADLLDELDPRRRD